MLGYVHRGQPNVILHSIKICISVTSVILCGFIVLELIKNRNIRNLMRINNVASGVHVKKSSSKRGIKKLQEAI